MNNLDNLFYRIDLLVEQEKSNKQSKAKFNQLKNNTIKQSLYSKKPLSFEDFLDKAKAEAKDLVTKYTKVTKLKNFSNTENEVNDFINFVSSENKNFKESYNNSLNTYKADIEKTQKERTNEELSQNVLKHFNILKNKYDFNLTTVHTVKDVLNKLIELIKNHNAWEYNNNRIEISLNSRNDANEKLNSYMEDILKDNLYFVFNLKIDKEIFSNQILYLKNILLTKENTIELIKKIVKKVDFNKKSWDTNNTKNDLAIFLQEEINKENFGTAILQPYSLEYGNLDEKLNFAEEYYHPLILHLNNTKFKINTSKIEIRYSFDDLTNEVKSYFIKNNLQDLFLNSRNNLSDVIRKINKKIKELYYLDQERIEISLNEDELFKNNSLLIDLIWQKYKTLNDLTTNLFYIPTSIKIDNKTINTNLYLTNITLTSEDGLNWCSEIISLLDLNELNYWTNAVNKNEVINYLTHFLKNINFPSINLDFENNVLLKTKDNESNLSVDSEHPFYIMIYDKYNLDTSYNEFFIFFKVNEEPKSLKGKVLKYFYTKKDFNLTSDSLVEDVLTKFVELIKTDYPQEYSNNQIKVKLRQYHKENEKLNVYIKDILEDNLFYSFDLEIDGEKINNKYLYLSNIAIQPFFENTFKKLTNYVNISSENSVVEITEKITNYNNTVFKNNDVNFYLHSKFYNEKINNNWTSIFSSDLTYRILASYKNKPLFKNPQILYLNDINLTKEDTFKRLEEIIYEIDFSKKVWTTNDTAKDVLNFVETEIKNVNQGSGVLKNYSLEVTNSNDKLLASGSFFQEIIIKIDENKEKTNTNIFEVQYSKQNLVDKISDFFSEKNKQNLSLTKSNSYLDVLNKIITKIKNIFYYEYKNNRIKISLSNEKEKNKLLDSTSDFKINFNIEIDDQKKDNQPLYLTNINDTKYEESNVILKSYYNDFINIENAKQNFHSKIILEFNFIFGIKEAKELESIISKPFNDPERIKILEKLFDNKSGIFKEKFSNNWSNVNSWIDTPQYSGWFLNSFLNYWKELLISDPYNFSYWFNSKWVSEGASFKFRILFHSNNSKYTYNDFSFYFNNTKIKVNTPVEDIPFSQLNIDSNFNKTEDNWNELLISEKKENELSKSEEKRKEEEEAEKRREEERKNAQKDKTIKQLEDKINTLKEEKDIFIEKINSLNKQIDDLNKEIDSDKIEIEKKKELEVKIDNLSKEKIKFENQIKNLENNIIKLKKEITEIQKKFEESEEKLKKIEENNKKIKNHILDIQSQIETLNKVLKATNIVLAALSAGFFLAGLFFGLTFSWGAACAALIGLISCLLPETSAMGAEFDGKKTVDFYRKIDAVDHRIEAVVDDLINNANKTGTINDADQLILGLLEDVRENISKGESILTEPKNVLTRSLSKFKTIGKTLSWAFMGIGVVLGIVDGVLWALKDKLTNDLKNEIDLLKENLKGE